LLQHDESLVNQGTWFELPPALRQTDLVSMADGSALWGDQLNRKVSDLIAVQRDIANGDLRQKIASQEGRTGKSL
jgi:hypothetical protein